MKKVIYIDVEKCLGCRSCEIECAVAHSAAKSLLGALREDPLPLPRVQVEAGEGFVMPLQCRHCEDAPCVTVCPSEALKKLGPEQPVIFEEVRRLERWHTTVELACCPACGERFAPARQVASIAEKGVPAEDWLYLCPQCRRKLLGRDLTWARAGKAGR